MTFTAFIKKYFKIIKNYYNELSLGRSTPKEKLHMVFRDIETGIENLITWFPIIWLDRYWDSHYLFLILKKKIELMERKFNENDLYVNVKRDTDNMRICIDALDRLMKDDYHEIAFQKHEEKWGELKMEFIPFDAKKCLSQAIFSRSNIKNEDDYKKEIEESKKCYEEENRLRNDDLKLLFNTLEKEVLKWWE